MPYLALTAHTQSVLHITLPNLFKIPCIPTILSPLLSRTSVSDRWRWFNALTRSPGEVTPPWARVRWQIWDQFTVQECTAEGRLNWSCVSSSPQLVEFRQMTEAISLLHHANLAHCEKTAQNLKWTTVKSNRTKIFHEQCTLCQMYCHCLCVNHSFHASSTKRAT